MKTFEQTMGTLAGKLAALKLPLCLKITATGPQGGSVYLDALAGTWSTQKAAGTKIDALLDGSDETLGQLGGALRLRDAINQKSLTFAGDISVVPLLERALDGGPPTSEVAGFLDYVPRNR